MKVYIVSIVLPMLIFLVCCRLSEAIRDKRASHRDATAIAAESTNVPTPQTVNNPTTIKPNAPSVTARRFYSSSYGMGKCFNSDRHNGETRSSAEFLLQLPEDGSSTGLKTSCSLIRESYATSYLAL
jgi:hypothetical protein